MNGKKNVVIIGATGYAGVELVRLLLNHPFIHVSALSSVSFTGQEVHTIHGCLRHLSLPPLINQEEAIQQGDVIFAALPHGHSQVLAEKVINNKGIFIDLGADFRLKDEVDYKKWYGKSFLNPELHNQAVYGLPELNKSHLSKTNIIANPGCYPTTVLLGLLPAAEKSLLCHQHIIADCKSGITGAGKTLSQATHFPDCNENIQPYNITHHRHSPEIETVLNNAYQCQIHLTFVPHLIPINRGILATLYIDKPATLSLQEIHHIYQNFYQAMPFVRVLPLGETCQIKNIQHANYCDISLHEDYQQKTLIVITALDNMVKGAAGQAIQNMNIRLGYPESTGLTAIPTAF